MVRPAWHAAPDARVRAWVAAAVGRGWRVTGARHLAGGIATAADLLRLEHPIRAHREVVLRRWLRPGWADEDPGLTPAHEAAVLDGLRGTGIPAPVVLAVDPDGAGCGSPALLADRLPGRRPTPSEERSPARLRAIGEALAAIHALDHGLRRSAVPFAPYYDLEPRRIPAGTSLAGMWVRAHEIVSIGPVPSTDVFLHRDLHPGNTLWVGALLTGIVDWTGASWGPAGSDLGHLRANLGPRHGIVIADRALAAYAAVAGGEPPDQAWWDLRMLIDMLDDPDAVGEADLDCMERYLEAVIARA